jgi:hypothetical protein
MRSMPTTPPIAAMKTNGQSWTWWISFADAARPEGKRHLGCCIVEIDEADLVEARADIALRFPRASPGAEFVAAACRKAHLKGCNPGGDVQAYDITNFDDPATLALERHKLFSRSELIAAGVVEG